MGERASTTSSIFHNNMFFMNNDIEKDIEEEKQDEPANLPRKELNLSPLKLREDLDHSASGGGIFTAAGNTEATNQKIKMNISSQYSEGRRLLVDTNKLQYRSQQFTDSQSQGQHHHGSIFKFEGFYHNGFENYSETESRSMRNNNGQSLSH